MENVVFVPGQPRRTSRSPLDPAKAAASRQSLFASPPFRDVADLHHQLLFLLENHWLNQR
ncbi:hypothetical protein HN51_020832 [Arachis hypogaea]